MGTWELTPTKFWLIKVNPSSHVPICSGGPMLLLLYIFYRVTYFHNELGITRLIYGTTPPPFYIRLYCCGSSAWTVEYVPCEIILYSFKV